MASFPQFPTDGQVYIDSHSVRWVFTEADNQWEQRGVTYDNQEAGQETSGFLAPEYKALLDSVPAVGGGFGIIIDPKLMGYPADPEGVIQGDIMLLSESLEIQCVGGDLKPTECKGPASFICTGSESTSPGLLFKLSDKFIDNLIVDTPGPTGKQGEKGIKGDQGDPGTLHGPIGERGKTGRDADSQCQLTDIEYIDQDGTTDTAIVDIRVTEDCKLIITKAKIGDDGGPTSTANPIRVERSLLYPEEEQENPADLLQCDLVRMSGWQIQQPTGDTTIKNLRLIRLPKGDDVENVQINGNYTLTDFVGDIVEYYKARLVEIDTEYAAVVKEYVENLDGKAREILADLTDQLTQCEFELPAVEYCITFEDCDGGGQPPPPPPPPAPPPPAPPPPAPPPPAPPPPVPPPPPPINIVPAPDLFVGGARTANAPLAAYRSLIQDNTPNRTFDKIWWHQHDSDIRFVDASPADYMKPAPAGFDRVLAAGPTGTKIISNTPNSNLSGLVAADNPNVRVVFTAGNLPQSCLETQYSNEVKYAGFVHDTSHNYGPLYFPGTNEFQQFFQEGDMITNAAFGVGTRCANGIVRLTLALRYTGLPIVNIENTGYVTSQYISTTGGYITAFTVWSLDPNSGQYNVVGSDMGDISSVCLHRGYDGSTANIGSKSCTDFLFGGGGGFAQDNVLYRNAGRINQLANDGQGNVYVAADAGINTAMKLFGPQVKWGFRRSTSQKAVVCDNTHVYFGGLPAVGTAPGTTIKTLAKYTLAGVLVWEVGVDPVYAIAVDKNGNVYTGGPANAEGITNRIYNSDGQLLHQFNFGSTVYSIALKKSSRYDFSE